MTDYTSIFIYAEYFHRYLFSMRPSKVNNRVRIIKIIMNVATLTL